MEGLDKGPILVTGAAGSIGGAIVRQLRHFGASVVASDMSEERLKPVAEETGCRILAFDLSSEDEVRSALENEDLWGLVNCAGFGGAVETPMEADVKIFDKAIAINTRGTFLATKYASRSMVRLNNGGAIVNISSQAGLVALDGHISYAASKAAVDSITRVSANELGKYGIRVNCVNPTAVITDMTIDHWGRAEVAEPYLEKMPLGRLATADEIAAPIIFLLSEGAAMISGVSLPIDGGYTAC